MSWTVTQEDILSIQADAAVLPLEITMGINFGPVSRRLGDAGGEALRLAIRQAGFIPAGSARAAEAAGLPFRHLLLAAPPLWLTGKANELLVLRRCYQNVFSLAQELGCRRVVMPFLSVLYYRFPLPEALHIARSEADKTALEVVFVADTEEIFRRSGELYRRPEIVSYVGWYRDHAVFLLDNGLYARVDLRPERQQADMIPYIEACFREGTDPLQPPLPPEEIARLRAIWEMVL